MLVLPQTEEDNGPRMYMFRPGCLNSEQFTTVDIYRLYILLTEISFWEDDNACIIGINVIHDFSNCSSTILMQLTPTFLKKFATWVDNVLPMRVKGVHYLNTPTMFESIFNLFKSWLPEKIRERVSQFFFC